MNKDVADLQSNNFFVDNQSLMGQFIKANREFFERRNTCIANTSDLILVDLQAVDAYFTSSMMRVAAAVSEVLGRRMMVLNAARASRDITAIVKSYCPAKVVNAAGVMLRGFLGRFATVIKAVATIKDGNHLVAVRIDDLPVGVHIYDLLLRRSGKPMLGKLSWKERVQVLVELAHTCGLQKLMNAVHIHYIVIPDNCYRNGLLFEIGKARNIPCLAAIDLNGISIHKYKTEEDYEHHSRTPDIDVVDRIMASPEAYSQAEDYCEKRTSAKVLQHDVVRAYASDKRHMTKKEIVDANRWDSSRKIIVVLAHVFCDAPHSAPNLVFRDYEDWLVQTCSRLSSNVNVNYLVKEHPSASLYNEQGLTERILEKHGLKTKMLTPHINTRSLFEWVDAVITCGGTAAMEFPCHGVPVLVAAEPPNYFEPYIVYTKTRDDYNAELDRIHKYCPLNANDQRRARAILYLVHEAMMIKGSDMGLGTQGLPFGEKVDCGLFYREMIHDLAHGTGYEALVRTMSSLIKGKHVNLLDYNKIDI
jgi:hypothetical protein